MNAEVRWTEVAGEETRLALVIAQQRAGKFDEGRIGDVGADGLAERGELQVQVLEETSIRIGRLCRHINLSEKRRSDTRGRESSPTAGQADFHWSLA